MSVQIAFRAAVLDWLGGDGALTQALTGLHEQAPPRSAEPSLGIGATEALDWSHKTGTGREIRITLNIMYRGQSPYQMQEIVDLVERRMEDMPAGQDGFRLVTLTFMRSRIVGNDRSRWSAVIDYRARVLLS